MAVTCARSVHVIFAMLYPSNHISDHLIPAIFIEYFMEQTAVNFHLFIGRRNGFKEIIGVLYIYKAVFSPCSIRTGYLNSLMLFSNQVMPSQMA